MKKLISVLLAAIMLMSCFGIVSFATVTKTGTCNCDGDHNPSGSCHCCIYCPNLDPSYVTACAKKSLDSEEKIVCCYECTGILGCTCGCSCCQCDDEDIKDDDNMIGNVWTDKEEFVTGFQAVIKKLSDFFDTVFDAIFEFLRIDEILGKH